MIMSYSIIVDSCCDLTPEMRGSGRFTSIPLTILVGGDEYVDDASLQTDLLLDAMAACPEGAHSACPSPAAYLDAFEHAEGDIYGVMLSAMLSGSYNSAWQASRMFLEEHPERNIFLFNSCSASSGETLIAAKIDELAGKGIPFDGVVAEVERYISEMNTLFVLEDLENLKKNGRLTRVQALLTGALHIKLLMGSTPEGEICKHGQALSIKQALGKMASLMAADRRHVGKVLCISHCRNPERAEYLRMLVMKTCDFKDIIITDTRGLSSFYAGNGGIVTAY